MKNPETKHMLILSGPMGNGHIRAAGALEACAHELHPDLKVTNINVKDFMPLLHRKFFHDLYLYFVNKCPFLWSYFYYKTDKPYSDTWLGRVIKWFTRKLTWPIMRKILKLAPDYIVCTHFIPAEILNDYKEKKDYNIPVSVIVTDFSLHWVYVNTALEHYFVNCTEVRDLLIARKIKSERIHITGCPVFPEFSKTYSRKEIRNLRKECSFEPEMPIFLVMMGGNGVGKMKHLCEILLKRFPEYAIIAMAGDNQRKIHELKLVEKEYPGRMLTVSFTNEVAKYMAISNIIITKPGGISTSECIAMKKPMIIINPIPGQEERNVDYLIERGIITKAYTEDSLEYREIASSLERQNFIISQLEHISMPKAGYDIIDTVLKD